jgi:hypothetical protein
VDVITDLGTSAAVETADMLPTEAETGAPTTADEVVAMDGVTSTAIPTEMDTGEMTVDTPGAVSSNPSIAIDATTSILPCGKCCIYTDCSHLQTTAGMITQVLSTPDQAQFGSILLSSTHTQ